MPARGELPPQVAIRKDLENGSTWKHKDLARDLYKMSDVFNFYFFEKQNPTDLALPKPVIEIEPARTETLAWYRLDHSGIGLKWHIGLNERHLNRPRWSIYESLVHETVHLFQESMVEMGATDMKSCRGGYHNRDFINVAEQIGLHPKLGEGWHIRPADGQFAVLMDRYAVAPPAPVEVPKDRPKDNWWDVGAAPKPKGTSTLIKYAPENPEACERKPACAIRSGRKDLELNCGSCGNIFVAQT